MPGRQLRIWKEDFLRYYRRTSLLARVAIGAALGFCIARTALDRVVKPQARRLKELRGRIAQVEVGGDADLTVADLRNKQRKIDMQLQALRTANRRLAETCGGLTRGETGRSLLDLRRLIDRFELRIVSEEPLRPGDRRDAARSRRRTSGGGARGRGRDARRDTRVVAAMPAAMGCDSYVFEVLGSFPAVQRFLIEAYASESLFLLNNVRIEQSREFLTDRDFHRFQALRCVFEAHVPYRKAAP